MNIPTYPKTIPFTLGEDPEVVFQNYVVYEAVAVYQRGNYIGVLRHLQRGLTFKTAELAYISLPTMQAVLTKMQEMQTDGGVV